MTATLLVALRRLLLAAIAVVFLLIAAVLAYVNPDPVALDVGFMRFERLSMSLVLVSAFVIGTLFGSLLFGVALLKHARERRQLRRDLKRAERELQLARNLSLPDAD